ncbi:MAG: peptidylprolyl isomerase [Actinomycetota bacterium]|nr:peptidylprolyl isomerase [Actinomycetota bacterium]
MVLDTSTTERMQPLPAIDHPQRNQQPPDASRAAAFRRRRIARATATFIVLAAAVAGGAIVNKPVGTRSTAARSPHAHRSSSGLAACGAQPPARPSPRPFPHPPPLRVAPGVDLGAIIHTSCGDITVDLLEKTAPKTVANFVFLAHHGFFNGRQWFRVENNAVIETGDPNDRVGAPPDGPGYTIPDELPGDARAYVYGVVAMANTGQPHSGGSTFFIVIHHGGPAGYDPRYSIFGKVEPSSYDVLDRIGAQKTFGGNDPSRSVQPIVPVYVNSVQIITR